MNWGKDSVTTDYGVLIVKPALTVRLQIRAVIIHDENDKVLHSQLAPELTAESDYAAALAAFGLEGITT